MVSDIRRFVSCLFSISVATVGVSLPLATIVSADDSLLTVQDVARIRSVTSAVIAPTDRVIAYTLSVPRDPMKGDDGPAWSELHVVDFQARSRPFVTGEVSVSAIGWTPNGHSISFLAKRNKDKFKSLYVIPLDGGEARRLIAHAASISSYSFSPDGNKIAFLATEAEDEEKKKLKDKGFAAEIYEENLRPVKVWIVDSHFDTNDKPLALKLKGSASELHWGPKGERLVVAIAPTPLIDHHYMYRRLRIVDAKTGTIQTKINNPGKIGPVRWSPDGTRIAFCSGEDINDPWHGQLMIASAKTGKFHQIIEDYVPDVTGIEWRDDKTILFSANDGCYTAYGEVGSDGKNRKIETGPSGPILSDMTLSDDRKYPVFIATTPQHPAEVFLIRGQKTVVRLTQSNPWLASRRLAKQEVIRYKARDGETIEGILIHPLDEKSGTRYPLILTVHGGPESQVPNGWVTRYSYPGQVAAAKGIASFYPNYRGSTGRGVPFRKAHQSDYGGREFNDLIDGVDHLIELGWVDKDKVGVTGASYGGFASAWCATFHTKRFAASVMFVGISDQISKSGTTDIADEMYHVHARKRIWEDWQFFLKRSPIYYVEQARTPILILHGKDDSRVHPSQSMELYRNLKIIGKTPVRLVFYPGEGHGNRKAAARFDYNMRSLRWMEHYLKGPGGDPPPNKIDYGLKEESESKTDASKARQ